MNYTKIVSLLFTIAVYFPTNSYSQAREELRDSLSLVSERLARDPYNIDLRLEKASLNMLLEQWSYAKEEYDYILDRSPDNIAALFYRAYANEKMYRYDFARIDYEHVLRIVPGHFESRLGLALVNQKDKKYTEALDQMNALVTDFPDSAIVYAARAGMEKERGMKEVALYDYSEALKREPDNKDYLLNRVDLLIAFNRKEEAVKDLDRLLELGVPRPALRELFLKLGKK